MPSLPRLLSWLCWLAVVVLAVLPLVADPFTLRLVNRILVYALFAVSLDLLVGFAGLVSLGHAAFWGIGGYVTATLIHQTGLLNPLLLAVAAAGVCAGTAFLIGIISLRTRAASFLMMTLALAQMLHALFHDLPFWGGSDGVNLETRPRMSLEGIAWLDFGHRPTLYLASLVALVAGILLLRHLLQTPFGHVLRAMQSNETRARALGHETRHHALTAFVLAGSLAGLAGFLEVCRTAFVSPAHLSWHESGHVLVTVILGGMGTLLGPVLGVFTLVLLEDQIMALTSHWLLGVGLFAMAVVLFLPEGLAGILLRRRPAAPGPEAVAACAALPSACTVAPATCPPRLGVSPAPASDSLSAAVGEPILATEALCRDFGGLRAVSDVSLRFARGRIHAVLGPNGAGKTTLINLLSGELRPSAGRIFLEGNDITGLSVPAIARRGIGRSYQKTHLFADLTCWEQCRLGAQSRLSGRNTFWQPVARIPEVNAWTAEALALCGLHHKAGSPAAALSHGEQRQLELAMVIATGARVLLLDEPLAGMGHGESRHMTALLRHLADHYTLILIEHDLEAVFALADTLTVMVNGTVLDTGDIATVRANPAVREVYLGDGLRKDPAAF